MASLLETREAKCAALRAKIRDVVPTMAGEEVEEWVDSLFAIGVSLREVEQHMAEAARRHRERERFDQGLQAAGFTVHTIAGRGDCLFGAVAHQVYGEEALHPLVRAKCVEFLRALHARDPRPSPELEPYLEKLARPRTWGDDTCARALSDIYARPVRVWVAGGADFQPQLHPDFQGAGAGNAAALELSNFSGACHFNSLVTPLVLARRLAPERAGEVEDRAIQRVLAGSAEAAAGAAAAAEAAAALAGEGGAPAAAGAGAADAAAEAAAAPDRPAQAAAAAEDAAAAAAAAECAAPPAEAPAAPALALPALEGACSGAAAAPPQPASPEGLLAHPSLTLSQHVQRSLVKSLSRAQRSHERGGSLSEGGAAGGAGAGGQEGGSSSSSEGGQGPPGAGRLTFPI